MEENIVRLFKLTYSGTLIEAKIEDLLNLINVNNILAIHGKQQKRMYIWVGKHATQSLQNLISKIRVITSREYSDLITLRYLNIDSGKEPDDFFEMISVPKEQIREKVESKLPNLIVKEINLKKEYGSICSNCNSKNAFIVLNEKVYCKECAYKLNR